MMTVDILVELCIYCMSLNLTTKKKDAQNVVREYGNTV